MLRLEVDDHEVTFFAAEGIQDDGVDVDEVAVQTRDDEVDGDDRVWGVGGLDLWEVFEVVGEAARSGVEERVA